jgi:hypothetical protein
MLAQTASIHVRSDVALAGYSAHNHTKPTAINVVASCIGYLVYPFKNRHFEKRLIKEKRERMSSWQERISWTRDAVLERESPPDLDCRVLERERASAKGGTERFGSAIEGESLLPSELRHRRGNEVLERSNPL